MRIEAKRMVISKAQVIEFGSFATDGIRCGKPLKEKDIAQETLNTLMLGLPASVHTMFTNG
jgi:hypothetical protein